MLNILKIFAITVIIVMIITAILLFANQGKQQAEKDRINANPLYHSVEQGGVCRADLGDCKVGLTCVNSICSKPKP